MEGDKYRNQLLFITIWICSSVGPCFGVRSRWHSSSYRYRSSGSTKEIFIGVFIGVIAVLITILIICVICKRLTRRGQQRPNHNVIMTVSAGVQASTTPPPYSIHDNLYSTAIQHITKHKSNSSELLMVLPPPYTESQNDQSPPAYSENTSGCDSEPYIPPYSQQINNDAT